MEYKTLTDEEKHDYLINTLAVQERDHYCHMVNKERYQAMLEDLPNGVFRDRIIMLLHETTVRISEVELIIAKLTNQLPKKSEMEASVTRLRGLGKI